MERAWACQAVKTQLPQNKAFHTEEWKEEAGMVEVKQPFSNFLAISYFHMKIVIFWRAIIAKHLNSNN